MRKILTLLAMVPMFVSAQPNGYYNAAFGLNGQALRVALHGIIKNHNSLGYSGLWTAFQQTDAKPNGKVWDIYSDKPGNTPPYQYSFGTDQCGNYNNEGDCYNREHTYPQSYFNSAEPVLSDLFQVYPTDGFVNGKRSDLMYGEVNSPNYTSQNGSKTGDNVYSGAPAGNAFEPIDSFKGDLARTYFYIASRYYSEDAGWSNWEMANGAELKTWAIQMLLDWHHNDPVSQKEINRNNAIYALQQNRNPFIDFPVFADCIWGTGDCSTLSVAQPHVKTAVDIWPNPASELLHIRSDRPGRVSSIEVFSIEGRLVWHQAFSTGNTLAIPVSGWTKGAYFIRCLGEGETTVQKILIN